MSCYPRPACLQLPAAVRAATTFNRDGLIAAIIQDEAGQVLMLGWMDELALYRTLTGKRVTFWSRSREEYWRKGDTSGHYQTLVGIKADCDGDALLVTVKQHGAACHTNTYSCFDGRELTIDPTEGAQP